MPTKAKLLIYPWTVAGIGLLVACVAADFRFPEPIRLVTCLALAMLGSTFKIKLPGMQGTLSIGFVLCLIAIAQTATFGKITNADTPRNLQLGLKLVW